MESAKTPRCNRYDGWNLTDDFHSFHQANLQIHALFIFSSFSPSFLCRPFLLSFDSQEKTEGKKDSRANFQLNVSKGEKTISKFNIFSIMISHTSANKF